jgi:hypothetical protein
MLQKPEFAFKVLVETRAPIQVRKAATAWVTDIASKQNGTKAALVY